MYLHKYSTSDRRHPPTRRSCFCDDDEEPNSLLAAARKVKLFGIVESLLGDRKTNGRKVRMRWGCGGWAAVEGLLLKWEIQRRRKNQKILSFLRFCAEYWISMGMLFENLNLIFHSLYGRRELARDFPSWEHWGRDTPGADKRITTKSESDGNKTDFLFLAPSQFLLLSHHFEPVVTNLIHYTPWATRVKTHCAE